MALTLSPAASRLTHARLHSAPGRVGLQLGLAALTIAAIFVAALILPVPFWQAHPAGPSPTARTTTDGAGLPAALLALGFLLALCVPFRPYRLALRAVSGASTRMVLTLTVLLAGAALLIYPAFGSDLFDYVGYERLWVVYHANPLVVPVSSHPADWSYAFVWFRDHAPAYGPLWAILTWPIASLGGDNLWGYIGGYKLLSLASYVACCGLVWACASPGGKKQALLVFAWSPLVLFEVLGKAHNDGLLAVSALAAVWLAARKDQPVLAMLAATAGALVKISGLAVALGLCVWLVRQRRWRELAIGLGASAVLAVAVYAPFWVGPASLLSVLVQTSRVVWSPGSLLVLLMTKAGLPGPEVLARVVMATSFAGVCGLVARRGGTLPGLAASLLLATLLLLTTAFFAHYLVPVVALSAVANNRRLERLALALSIGSLAAYSVELLGAALPGGWIGSPGYQALGSALSLGPAAVVWLTDRCRGSGWLRPRG